MPFFELDDYIEEEWAIILWNCDFLFFGELSFIFTIYLIVEDECFLPYFKGY